MKLTDSERLEKIESMIESMLLGQKRVLSFSEGCRFIGMSESYAYKLTAKRTIPHSKPDGKKIFFDREELEAWLLRNPVKTKAVLIEQAREKGVLTNQ